LKITFRYLILFTFIAVIASCSTKKDSVISRNYHALTTKYNILFNGNNAFDKGIDEINNSYRDDWFLQLPLEPIEFEEDKKYKGYLSLPVVKN
jgi:hypothetical protein